MRLYKKQIFLSIIFSIICTTMAMAQSAAYETFGRIKMQKDVMEWQYLDTTNFRIFYYSYGKYNAQYLLQQAEIDLPTISKLVNTDLSKKVNIVLYNSFKDYKQTNIGRSVEGLNTAEGGKLDISGNSIVIYFDGTHDGLRKQLRKGVVKTLRDNLLFGKTLKEIIRKASSSELPEWFTNGYLNFLSEDWTADEANLVRNQIQHKSKFTFDDYVQNNAALFGKSFFNFVNESYGESYVNNMMYMANGGSSVAKICSFVFNKSYKELRTEWKDFYLPIAGKDSTEILNRKFLASLPIPALSTITKFSMSPDGKSLAYVVEKQKVYKINIFDVAQKKSFTIIEGGMRHGMELADMQYPIIAWSLNGKKLAVMYEKEAYQRLKVWDAKKGRISERIFTTNKFDRIHSMNFMEDDEKLVISAIKKGQSDLYQFVTKGGQMVNITKDIWDEINPSYVKGNGFDGILFFSNRDKNTIGTTLQNGTLPNTKFHLYYYNAGSASPILVDCSKDAELPISQPTQYGSRALCFLADKDGYKQRYIFELLRDEKGKDSINFLRNAPIDANIVYHSYNRKDNAMIDIILRNNKYEIYTSSIKLLDSVDKANETPSIQKLTKIVKTKYIDSLQPTSYILTDFVDDIDSMDAIKNYVENKTPTAIRKFRAKEYKRSFHFDNAQLALDNSLLFNRYQRLDHANAPFTNPPLTSMFTASLVDVMEDYRIMFSFRPNFNRTFSYLAKFGNYRKRLDWEILFVHNADTIIRNNSQLPITDPLFSRYAEEYGVASQNYLQGKLMYPFNSTSSVQFTTGIRNEHTQYKATSEYSITFPTRNEYWSFSRLEYIHDNTITPFVNISKGLKYKVWGEAFSRCLMAMAPFIRLVATCVTIYQFIKILF